MQPRPSTLLAQGNRDGIAPFTFSSEKGRSAGRGISLIPTTEERKRREERERSRRLQIMDMAITVPAFARPARPAIPDRGSAGQRLDGGVCVGAGGSGGGVCEGGWPGRL
jgi:hypothetical protein